MRVFALELDNDLKGIPERKAYIEGLIARLPSPELVVLPELALCSYMASQAIWQYADEEGRDAEAWAVETARTYGTFLGVGFLARSGGDYYNRYLIAGPEKVFGAVSKSEGEAAVFRRGSFGSLIPTPFGNVAVGICYDSRRRHFYENVKDASLSMILFPHGAPADPKKPEKERRENDLRCTLYANAWGVPVVYVNSRGSLEPMPGKMGEMMRRRGFRMNGMTRIYAPDAVPIPGEMPEAVGAEVKIHSKRRVRDIHFYGDDILPGNRLFRRFVLKPDTEAGIKVYESNK
jgi:predicted amidohydrolase